MSEHRFSKGTLVEVIFPEELRGQRGQVIGCTTFGSTASYWVEMIDGRELFFYDDEVEALR